jgi:solute carrier family 25 (adenine nucleotide translocator) protein 4/5/6/31
MMKLPIFSYLFLAAKDAMKPLKISNSNFLNNIVIGSLLDTFRMLMTYPLSVLRVRQGADCGIGKKGR